MSSSTAEFGPQRRNVDGRMLFLGVSILAIVLALSAVSSSSIGPQLTRNTIRLSLAWYCASLLLMTRLTHHEWTVAAVRGRIARWCWTWGLVSFFVHLGMAFHFYHHWSHAHAFEHTRDVSGIGEGIYFSYLFTWLWILDVVWWWWWPNRYATRSAWWDRCLHAYMLFIIFNGTIIFEAGLIRWAGVVMFTALAIAWAAR